MHFGGVINSWRNMHQQWRQARVAVAARSAVTHASQSPQHQCVWCLRGTTGDETAWDTVDDFVIALLCITRLSCCWQLQRFLRRLFPAIALKRMVRSLLIRNILLRIQREIRTKIDELVSYVFSPLFYAAETMDYIKVLYRRILKVCWRDRISNKTTRENIERHCT